MVFKGWKARAGDFPFNVQSFCLGVMKRSGKGRW